MLVLSYFTEPAVFPFAVALLVVLILALIEGVGLLIGAGIFSFLDGVLPDLDIDTEISAPDLTEPSIIGNFLTWLRVGKVPAIFSLIIFLVGFGLVGLFIQDLALGLLGFTLPLLFAIPLAVFLSMPILRGGNKLLALVMPRDETSAVSKDSLIGKLAVITLGEATLGSPAQAKVKDEFNQTHYVMVSPDIEGEAYQAGETVLLVSRESTFYFAIQTSSAGFSNN